MGTGSPQSCVQGQPAPAVGPWIPGMVFAEVPAQLLRYSWPLLGWDFLTRSCLEQALA